MRVRVWYSHLYSQPGWFFFQLSCQGLKPSGTLVSFHDWWMMRGT